MESTYPIYKAKIKVTEVKWHGLVPEELTIPKKETVLDIISGSYMLVQSTIFKEYGLFCNNDIESKNMKRVSFEQREGFRVFISWSKPDNVGFTPETRILPIKGDEFPVIHALPLKRETLTVGKSFKVSSDTIDSGVNYTIELLEISEHK